MLTILHLITGLETGGAERMLVHLVSRADRSRLRPVVVSMTGPGTMGPLIESAGVPLRTLGIRRGVPDPRGIARLARILREFRPAVLQTWLYHADLLGLIVRRLGLVPHLVWGLQGTETIDTPVVRRLLAWSSASPDAVVTVSQVGQRFHEGIGYHPRRWVHLPNAVDTAALRPDPDARRRGRAALGIADHTIAILLPARYHPMKDQAGVIGAARRVVAEEQEVLFVMAGAGLDGMNTALAAAIRECRLEQHVRLVGETTCPQALLSACDLFCLPSAWGEGFPNAVGEAMACELPCVVTRVGDGPDLVGATGMVVDPGDREALAQALLQLVRLGHTGRARLGVRARSRIAESFSLPDVAARYAGVFDEAVSAVRP